MDTKWTKVLNLSHMQPEHEPCEHTEFAPVVIAIENVETITGTHAFVSSVFSCIKKTREGAANSNLVDPDRKKGLFAESSGYPYMMVALGSASSPQTK